MGGLNVMLFPASNTSVLYEWCLMGRKKKWRGYFIFAVVAIACAQHAFSQHVELLRESGPSSNRVNFAIIGEGYTEAEVNGPYAEYAQDLCDYWFGDSVLSRVYYRYRNFINV